MPADLLAQLLAGLDTFKQRAGRFAANPMQGLAERSGPVFGVEPPPQKSARERIEEMLNVENISETPAGQAAFGMMAGPLGGAGKGEAVAAEMLRRKKMQELLDYQRRIMTDVEGLEGEAKYKALREIAAMLQGQL